MLLNHFEKGYGALAGDSVALQIPIFDEASSGFL